MSTRLGTPRNRRGQQPGSLVSCGPSVREVCLLRVARGEAAQPGNLYRRERRTYRITATQESAGDGGCCYLYLRTVADANDAV